MIFHELCFRKRVGSFIESNLLCVSYYGPIMWFNIEQIEYFKDGWKISKSSRILLVYIAPQDYTTQIMTHNLLYAVQVCKGIRTHLCGGKIQVKRRGLEVYSYIKSKCRSTWDVHLRNDHDGSFRKYRVFQYCPICFLIRADGAV